MTENDYPNWFFMWGKKTGTRSDEYLTSVCGWTRKDLIYQIEKQIGVWSEVKKRGGKCVKVKISLVKTKRAGVR
jgi:hypothetical protein